VVAVTDHPLTPAAAERRLVQLDTAMTQAELMLRRARDAEVEKKHEYEAAKRRAFLSAECPKPTRGGYTVADRDVWVDDRCATEQRAYDVAVAAREAAQDHHRTVRDQAMVAMALLRSVSTAFNMSGVTP
jgi:hypothetical protein